MEEKEKKLSYIDTLERRIVNIHSGAISIENKVSLISRKAWFYMVYKAFPKLLEQEKFSVSLVELKDAIGYDSTNNKYLKKALLELSTTAVEWNILKKDKSIDWEVNAMLAGCRIPKNSGVCEFAFSPFLKEKLSNPEMYVKLDLLMSKRFKSKHTLSVYCFALDYLQVKYNFGSKNLSIEELRKILGLKENEYIRTVDINKEILKKAEKEINESTDLKVSIHPIRTQNRKIIGFKFEMSIKDEYITLYRSKNVTANDKQISLFTLEKNKDKEIEHKSPFAQEVFQIENEKLKKFFAKYNIAIGTTVFQSKLNELKNFIGKEKIEDYLTFLSQYTEGELEKGTIKNLAGLYVSILKDDTQIDNYMYFLEKEREKEQKKDILVKSKITQKLQEDYLFYLKDDFINYLISNINVLEQKIVDNIKKYIKTGTFVNDLIINKSNKGIIDKTLITNTKPHERNALIVELEKQNPNFRNDMKYKETSYEEWEDKIVTKEYIEKIKNDIKSSI